MQIRKGDIYFADLSPVADDHRSGGDVAAEEGETADPRTYSRGRQRTRPGFRRTAGTAEDDRQEET